MIYFGLDVHKRFSRMGCFDPGTGALHDLGSVSNDAMALQEALERLPSPKTVVLEAGRSSYYMAGLLESTAEEVWIVDPGEVRRLQQTISKTDRRDAAALAWWAAKGVLKPQWRPDTEILNLRELTRGKIALTRMSTQVRTMIRALLASPWEILIVVQTKADEFERIVAQTSREHPVAQRLRTIPGIGPFLSLALAVEIGEINRFPGPTQLRGYSGLVPAVYQSGDKEARGPLTKAGNKWLRYAAVLAAQRILLSVAFRHGRNPGKIAVARRLLDLIYILLKKGQDYRAPRPRAAATA